jgi:DNA-binding CsgD family transcriptional regulator
MNPHQHRLLQFRLSGTPIDEIAHRLKVKPVTVKFHLTKIYKILGASGGRHVAEKYFEYRKMKGLTELPHLREQDGGIYLKVN